MSVDDCLDIPALGRSARLGSLYNSRTDTFLGENIFSESLILGEDYDEDKLENPKASVEVVEGTSFENKCSVLKIEGNLKLNILAGAVKISGKANFLKDEQQTVEQESLSAVANFIIMDEEIDSFRRLKSKIDLDFLAKNDEATHVVSKVVWGADCYLTFYWQSTKTTSMSSGYGEGNVKVPKVFKTFLDLACHGKVDQVDSNFAHLKNKSLKLDSDIVSPEDFDIDSLEGALKTLKRMPENLARSKGGKGVRVGYVLQPLVKLRNRLGIKSTSAMIYDIQQGIQNDCIRFLSDQNSLWSQAEELSALIKEKQGFLPLEQVDVGRGLSTAILKSKDQAQHCILEELKMLRASKEQDSSSLSSLISGILTDNRAQGEELAEVQQFFKITIKDIQDIQDRGIQFLQRGEALPLLSRDPYYALHGHLDLRNDQHRDAILILERFAQTTPAFVLDPMLHPDDKHKVVAKNELVIVKYQGGKMVSKTVLEDELKGLKKNLIVANTSVRGQATKPRDKLLANLKLHCPGSASRHGCKAKALIWECKDCGEEMMLNLSDKRSLFCSTKCGQLDIDDALFRCSDPGHGRVFKAFEGQESIASRNNTLDATAKKRVVNILLLGDSGVGKTTFINAVTNNIAYGDFEIATRSETPLLCPIPCKISEKDMTGKEHTVELGVNDDENEAVNNSGQSCTQGPKCHVIDFATVRYNLIDTPGINDTRGDDQDMMNIDFILRSLTLFPHLDAICLLLKADTPRLTDPFIYCVRTILTHLHKSAKQNLVFVFTNASLAHECASSTIQRLNEFFTKEWPNERAPSQDAERCFKFDNIPFRHLAFKKHSSFPLEARHEQNAAERWALASEEIGNMFQYIKGLQAHKADETVEINRAKSLIRKMIPAFAELVRNICFSVIDHKTRLAEIEATSEEDIKGLKEKCTYIAHEPDLVQLDKPESFCWHDDCRSKDLGGNMRDRLCKNSGSSWVEYKSKGWGNFWRYMNYPFGGGIFRWMSETVNCKACDESNKICGHNNTTAHYWDTSYYTTKMVTKKNTEALEELENKTVSHTKVKEGMVQAQETLIKEMKSDLWKILNVAAMSSFYVLDNSLNKRREETFKDILQKMIRDAESQSGNRSNRWQRFTNFVAGAETLDSELSKLVNDTLENYMVIFEAMKSEGKPSQIDWKQINGLKDLKHVGETFAKLQEGIRYNMDNVDMTYFSNIAFRDVNRDDL